jgi:uncharacterized protein YecE (DUF72 family)
MVVTDRVRVGCSGWNYQSWRGRFYPKELPASRWLEYYARHFDTVEINNTFYRLPERSTFVDWRTHMPAEFLAAVKASRFLTHMKRLRDPEEPLDRLFTRASALGRKLGPVLYQLPGHFRCDIQRLETFLTALPRAGRNRRIQHVMEFRHPSWYVPEVFRLLERLRVGLCLHDKTGSPISEPFVGPFAYVRFHGASGDYHGSYSQRQLDRWAETLADYAHRGRRVYAYFNNDPNAVAVANAQTLRSAIARHGV